MRSEHILRLPLHIRIEVGTAACLSKHCWRLEAISCTCVIIRLIGMGFNVSSFLDSLNLSDQQGYWTDNFKFADAAANTYAVCVFCLIPVIVVANAMLIVSIITDVTLKEIFRYRVIVSIALADLLIGLITCPVRAEISFTAKWRHSCSTYLFVSALEMYVQIFVAMWGIVSINMDCLMTLYKVRLPTLPPRQQKLVIGLILTLPWVAMFIIVLPVAYANGKLTFDRSIYQCYLLLPDVAKHIVMSFTYILPGLIITCQCIIMSAAIICHRRWTQLTSSLMTSSETTRPSWIFVISSGLTVIMLGMEQCTHLAEGAVNANLDYKTTIVLYYTEIFISDSKSAVTPLLWFAFPELRTAFFNRLPWRRVNNAVGDVNDTIVSYKDMRDETI